MLKSMRHNKNKIHWCRYILKWGTITSDFDATNWYEITSFRNWEPWIEGLLISLLCGDQCHCWKVVHKKLGKWCSHSECCKWCQMCLNDNVEFVRFTTIWELDEVSTDLILKQFWSNRAWHIAKLAQKICKWGHCGVLQYKMQNKSVVKYGWENFMEHVVHIKSILVFYSLYNNVYVFLL